MKGTKPKADTDFLCALRGRSFMSFVVKILTFRQWTPVSSAVDSRSRSWSAGFVSNLCRRKRKLMKGTKPKADTDSLCALRGRSFMSFVVKVLTFRQWTSMSSAVK
jgi:hypothetical protein